MNEINLNHYFKEETEEKVKKKKKKYRRTPKKIRLLILRALKSVGGDIPNNPWHIRMLTAKIVHEYRVWVSTYQVYKYLMKSKSVLRVDNRFILKTKEGGENGNDIWEEDGN